MQAIRLRLEVSPNRTVQLPANTPIGPAEVILLFDSEPAPIGSAAKLLATVAELRAGQLHTRTKAEIDASIEEERASWDDPE